jgi:hypothetical protein
VKRENAGGQTTSILSVAIHRNSGAFKLISGNARVHFWWNWSNITNQIWVEFEKRVSPQDRDIVLGLVDKAISEAIKSN